MNVHHVIDKCFDWVLDPLVESSCPKTNPLATKMTQTQAKYNARALVVNVLTAASIVLVVYTIAKAVFSSGFTLLVLTLGVLAIRFLMDENIKRTCTGKLTNLLVENNGVFWPFVKEFI